MSHTPESPDPDDLLLSGRDRKGELRWPDPGTQVPYGRVLHSAALLGLDPAVLVSRLEALGYADIQQAGTALPDTVRPDDAPLVRRVGVPDYGKPWLDVAEPVPLRHVLEVGCHTGRGPADVARRLTALGYRLGGDVDRPLPESSHPADVMLILEQRTNYRECRDWGDEVPAHHVHDTARDLSISPHFVATRLVALGFRLPYTPEPGDEALLTHRGSHEPGHILGLARETGRTPEDIVGRLTELGCGRPEVPAPPQPDDLVLLSANVDGRAPWLLRYTAAGLLVRHILRAALATGRSPAEVAARLAELGYRLHEDANLPAVADEADIRLLETIDRSYQDDVHLGDVLRSASLTGRSPADVAARLTALGHRLPDEVDHPEVRGLVTA
ncbi:MULTISPECIES: wHTH domain-containing protein [Streptomyces]|uniref:wHTH domain-containing protein n=1 Tax=Streptomyces TaxID=1883 RepID=UPI0029BA3657|nr:hypothetical protein [Streptomyces sp. ND04-05B]MDX3064958.1 hypothetical protein [Streptomyces sp. ND04-05B]